MSGTTEAFARVNIDALLQDAGWNLTDRSSVLFEHALPDGTQADYVLCDRQGRPMAALEAKRASTDPMAAQDQGKHYAEQLGVPFVFLSNGEEVRFRDRETDARARNRRLLCPRRPRTADRRATSPPRPIDGRHRPEDRRPRLPDRVHRGAVRRSLARAAQTAGRNGDGDRQDPYGGGVHQAAVRGGHRHPRPVPRRPDRTGAAGRGRVHRPSARLSLSRAAARPRLRPRQAHHRRNLADHDRGIPRPLRQAISIW